jgi:NAD(P)H-quinone oxidoreductase subunit 5
MILFALGTTLVSFSGAMEVIIIGWEIVGLTSVLLVSFFNYRKNPVKNSLWVFINYRICDIGLLVAILVIHTSSHNSVFVPLETANWLGFSHENMPSILGFLIIFAVIGKSALFPLSGWLPRAMEGPTPSSAIFYGAISIHLGPLLLLRSSDLISSSPALMATIIVIGIVTALFGRAIGRGSTDIKGMLAYSSIMQVGIIVAEIGFGLNEIALIHMIGHGSFRTLQILRAPNLLHDRKNLAEMLGHHAVTAQDREGSIYLNRDYKYYYFVLEKGFLDNLLKKYLRKFLSVFLYIDEIERRWSSFIGCKVQDKSYGGRNDNI